LIVIVPENVSASTPVASALRAAFKYISTADDVPSRGEPGVGVVEVDFILHVPAPLEVVAAVDGRKLISVDVSVPPVSAAAEPTDARKDLSPAAAMVRLDDPPFGRTSPSANENIFVPPPPVDVPFLTSVTGRLVRVRINCLATSPSTRADTY
jgi:hypothetical protein